MSLKCFLKALDVTCILIYSKVCLALFYGVVRWDEGIERKNGKEKRKKSKCDTLCDGKRNDR